MKKLLIIAAVVLATGTGLAFAFKSSGPTKEQTDAGIASTWNVQEVSSSWEGDKLMALVTWKDLTQAQSAADQLCQLFPLSKVLWDNKLGEARAYECQ
ncbi:hypothetical protein NKK48_01665 [Mesorhizobium sp. C386A]|uniref:hypothetical protein n=1 Tax=unclassified Mesorhizobium TaxID=325217 RepID=UPI0003CF7257|nr:hypothetical protein [Mesorhizobium sp. LNJC386A00]ESY35786.1 hypothetical protein X748_14355 [Mesorhizobium sp. LNJC386A00]